MTAIGSLFQAASSEVCTEKSILQILLTGVSFYIFFHIFKSLMKSVL